MVFEKSTVQLWFDSVSEIVGSDDLGLIMLADETKQRQLSIVCEKTMAVQLEIRAKKMPFARTLLPEVMARVVAEQTDVQLVILFCGIEEGQYRVLLINQKTQESLVIRASDAVLLSKAGNIPLYIESWLMDRQSVPYSLQQRGVVLPVNTLSNEMLENALMKAVEDENYELASQLRDERNRRKSKSSSKF